jgi:hypothetical protein
MPEVTWKKQQRKNQYMYKDFGKKTKTAPENYIKKNVQSKTWLNSIPSN